MPIEVELPDGTIAEFPDGMENAAIERVLAQQFGGQQQPDFSNVQSGASTQPAGGNTLTRALGQVGGRQVLQGAAGLYGALGGDALNHYVLDPVSRATGVPLGTGGQTYREAASGLADRLGMAAPQTSGQRIASDVGEALTGTGLTMGLGALANAARPAGNRLAQILTARPGLQTVSTATGAGAAASSREGGGSQGQQLAAGLIGGLAPGVAGATGAASLRGLVRGRDGAQMQRTIADFNALGANPSVAQASGNRTLQGAENLLAGGPTSAGVMARFAERQADDIGGGLQRLAGGLSPRPSAENAGRAIERGVDTFRGNARAQQRALYWQADRQIPAQSPVNVQQTWQELVRLTSPTPGATATTGAMVHPKIAQLRQNLAQDVAAGNGTIPYSALQAIRSQIGEQISDFSMTPDAPTRQLRQLYGALSRDMEAAAKAAGPQAEMAARRANTYTRTLNDRLEEVQRVVDKNGGPEAIYTAAMSGTRDGGTTLRKVMQSLPQQGQRSVTAAVIRRMGMPTAGQAGVDAADEFSAATFLTNWNRVSPEAKRALFDRHGPDFSRNMDRIARVADNIKQGSKVFANPSGTTNRAAALTYGASLALSILDPTMATTGTLIAGGLGANVAARAMTNPRVVRWLASATSMPVGPAMASLRDLAAQAERDGDEDAAEFARAVLAQQPEGAPR